MNLITRSFLIGFTLLIVLNFCNSTIINDTAQNSAENATTLKPLLNNQRDGEEKENETKTIRGENARSLNVNEKFTDYHNENKVYHESRGEETSSNDYERKFNNMDLTTPKQSEFDLKYQKLKDEISKTVDEKEKLFSIVDERDDKFDFDHPRPYEAEDRHKIDIEPPKFNDSDFNVSGFKNADYSETKTKNKLHKDFNLESGKRSEVIKSYSTTVTVGSDQPNEENVSNLTSTPMSTSTIKPEEAQESSFNHVNSSSSKNTITKSTQQTPTTTQSSATTQKPIFSTRSEKEPSDLDDQSSDSSLSNNKAVQIYIEEMKSMVNKERNEPVILDEIAAKNDYERNMREKNITKFKMPTSNTNNSTLDKTGHDILSINEVEKANETKLLDIATKLNVETKLNAETKLKVSTSTVKNLEDLNTVEVTTASKKLDIENNTEKNKKSLSRKMETYEVKMVNAIKDKDEEATLDDLREETKESEITTPTAVFEIEIEETTTLKTTTENLSEDETTLKQDEEATTEETTTEETTQEEKTPEETTTEKTAPEKTTMSVATFKFDETGTDFLKTMEEILTNSTQVPPEIITEKFYEVTNDAETTEELGTTTVETITAKPKKNESISNIVNEIIKSTTSRVESDDQENDVTKISFAKTTHKMVTTTTPKVTTKSTINETESVKQNEINVNGDKSLRITEKPAADEEEDASDEDYIDPANRNKDQDDEIDENIDGHNKLVPFNDNISVKPKETTPLPYNDDEDDVKTVQNASAKTRFSDVEINLDVTTIPGGLTGDGDDDGDGSEKQIIAIVISTVGGVCLLLLVGLLIIMRKRQKRFNYGQRCRPVSLDAYSMDNVSIHNSTRRKGVLMASRRSYGNPAFDDPNCPSHQLNFNELTKFSVNVTGIDEEFDSIPQIQAKTSELPDGCEVKNRYANVIPLPETRVFISRIEGQPNSDYINANFVTGPKGQRHYYIASQAPLLNTIEDFWRMIWEQEIKVILMLTQLHEGGVEKCIDYLPPSEVLDCHRLFGDYQVTLKGREVRDKYTISSLQLRNMVSNSWREVTHMWYTEWPHRGAPDEPNSLVRFLIEARSFAKSAEAKARETSAATTTTTFINGGSSRTTCPILVHCSPGTGRTGTVIACDIAIREFELTRCVDVPKIVYRIRRDRASSVQTKEQYSFIYKVINFYAKKLTGGAFDSF